MSNTYTAREVEPGTTPIAYHVYADVGHAVHEDERATLHNARRLAAKLRRLGFGTCIRAAFSRVVDAELGVRMSWCETVEAIRADGTVVS